MNASPDTAADLMRYKKADLVERIVALQGRVDQWEEVSTIQAILSNGLPYRYIDLAADAVLVVDRDSNFVDLNPALCSQLGYSRAELLGMKVDDVLSAGEDSWQKKREAIELNLRNSANVELACRRKDGTTITFDISARTLDDGRFLAFARDATERKQAEAAVRGSEAQLKHIIETSPVGIAGTNLDGSEILFRIRALTNSWAGLETTWWARTRALISQIPMTVLQSSHIRRMANAWLIVRWSFVVRMAVRYGRC